MGENEDKQDQAIKFALVRQRVETLECWKREHEQQQEAKMERLENATNNSIANLENKLDKFVASIGEKIDKLSLQIEDQKLNYGKRIPWPLMLLVTSLSSCVVYLLTKK